MNSFENGRALVKQVFDIIVLCLLCLFSARQVAALGEEVRVGTWKTPQTIQPFFYERFMEPPGKVKVFPFTNPADQKTALLAGSLEMCGTTLVHAIESASMGQPVVIVAALCNKASALVVRRDGPVDRVAALRGLRIGYVPGTMHEILLREVLSREGISPEKDVTLTRVDFFDMGTALAAGNLDAFLSGEPLPTAAVERGYGRVLAYPYFDDSIGTINAAMLVTRKTVQERPELVRRLVLAHARATRYLNDHPDEWLKKASEFGIDLQVLEKARGNMELAWDMDETFVERVRNLGRRMEELGVIDRRPDYDRLFDLSFLRSLGPDLDRKEARRP